MRYRKKEFWKRLNILFQTNQKFQMANQEKGIPDADELAGCQSIALEMGTCLETLGKIAEPVVRLLEDYCENLYQQSVQLDNRTVCRMISRKIQKHLERIIRMIQFDLPEGKKEVVFLPYKASMWDSLESVWLAAREDEDCESVVVSVPYFDKNPDGSLGKMYDERNQYPEYVPVIGWQEYSVRERCPDIIYIHNPYDEANYVTSVHPAFYSRELKKYTDMLIYIPYFLGVDNYVGEHFCVLPGTVYADRVIVESEQVRQIYLKAFQKFEQENHCQGRFGNLKQKILPLGSPKLDRVRSIMQNEITVPKEWERHLVKEDGTRKKVILYNTTIDSLLKHDAAALKKVRNILSIFKHYEDLALLWRPHPLLLATARSMRPALYSELCRIVQEYKEEGFGIYDDTADVERAIALSDAYYGDWSSVVTLYQATGKPIMIQNYEEMSADV